MPNGYFSEELRSSGDVIPGFSIEFGRYYYDSHPIIGELLDINAWDFILDESEMKAITDCKSFNLRGENMINMKSASNVTGPLWQPIERDSQELRRDILLPIRASRIKEHYWHGV